jgi:hypothetical protein
MILTSAVVTVNSTSGPTQSQVPRSDDEPDHVDVIDMSTLAALSSFRSPKW